MVLAVLCAVATATLRLASRVHSRDAGILPARWIAR